MQNESQNIEYKESWGRGFKKIAEEFERASLPLPTIEENGGGVMAIIQRKTVDEVIAARDGNVGNMSVTNVGNVSVRKLSDRQRNIISMIEENPFVTAKEMSVTNPWIFLQRHLAFVKNPKCHRLRSSPDDTSPLLQRLKAKCLTRRYQK